jgi:hypothetical protein
MASFKSGTAPDVFDKDLEDMAKFRRMYVQGGIVAESMDAYPLFVWANGYALEGEEGAPAEAVQLFLDSQSVEVLGHRMIVDALVVGRGIAEIVWNRARNQVVGLQYRPAETFRPLKDARGNVVRWRQTVKRDNETVNVLLEPDQVFVLELDMHLIRRAYQDIIADAAIADATVVSIQRHGYSRYHVQVGLPGERVPRDTLQDLGKEFEDLKPNMEWVTTKDVSITNIDQSGVHQAQPYSNWAAQRLAAALGVPEEMLGLGRGSTEATANVRLDTFKQKIGSIQRRFSSQLNRQVVDRLTQRPGSVWFKFNEASIDALLRKAEVVAKLFQANQADPYAIITPEWAQEFLEIEVEEEEGDAPE